MQLQLIRSFVGSARQTAPQGLFSILFLLITLVAVSGAAKAAIVSFDPAVARGNCNVTDCHSGIGGGGHNFIVGQQGTIFRNYFVYDLSSISGTINSATLRLQNPPNGAFIPDFIETYTLFDVHPIVTQLLVDNEGSTFSSATIFNDLGSGTVFATRGVSILEVGSSPFGDFIDIAINSAGIAAMNSAAGFFAFGGAITSLDDPDIFLNEFLFGFTAGAGWTSELVLDVDPVPLPAAVWLLGSGLLGMICIGRRKKSAAAQAAV